MSMARWRARSMRYDREPGTVSPLTRQLFVVTLLVGCAFVPVAWSDPRKPAPGQRCASLGEMVDQSLELFAKLYGIPLGLEERDLDVSVVYQPAPMSFAQVVVSPRSRPMEGDDRVRAEGIEATMNFHLGRLSFISASGSLISPLPDAVSARAEKRTQESIRLLSEVFGCGKYLRVGRRALRDGSEVEWYRDLKSDCYAGSVDIAPKTGMVLSVGVP